MSPPTLWPALEHPMPCLVFWFLLQPGFLQSCPKILLHSQSGTSEWNSEFLSSTAVWTWAISNYRGQGHELSSPSSCVPTALPGLCQLQCQPASHLHPPPGPWAGRRARGIQTSSGSSPTVAGPTHKSLFVSCSEQSRKEVSEHATTVQGLDLF